MLRNAQRFIHKPLAVIQKKEMKIITKIKHYRHPKDKNDFFSNLSFNIPSNGFYLLTGISGIGKSTLMRIMLGIYDGHLDGSVSYSINNEKYTGRKLREKGQIGYHSDDFSLIPWKTIENNIKLPKELNDNLPTLSENLLNSELKTLGLSKNILNKYPHQLSYGMKARIGILRACIFKPKVLFLDELFSGIDSFNNRLIINYLENKKNHSIIIGISHQIERAIKISDKVIILNNRKEILLTNTKSTEHIINQLILN